MILSVTPEAFQAASPFPHVVIDDLMGPGRIAQINSEWPRDGWNVHQHGHSDKRGNPHIEAFGLWTRGLIQMLNCQAFVEELGRVSGIAGLSADHGLAGGGLHETFPGGFLDIHADFNIHPETRLYRRLNLLLYLNEEWQEEWGGQLELWDREKVGCEVKVSPVAGRCVIFETSDSSFHGHPERLTCPPDRSRRSIALYYYSAEAPKDSRGDHSTLYLGDEDTWYR